MRLISHGAEPTHECFPTAGLCTVRRARSGRVRRPGRGRRGCGVGRGPTTSGGGEGGHAPILPPDHP
ncbi:hypothetical protein C884_02525 [Kocuria palustris PEL]|uniref:Uncharacterized protein n=1 Tax=Kocuria palustris PEL TaxID=1236550 RepID=M2YDT5_9MICC|nr:hypothetical protein C884_02525 [Kocuria palustris PEL]